MRDITPETMRCHSGMDGCPALIEVTPQDMACVAMQSCSAIYEREDGHVIIGKIMGFSPQTPDRDAMLAGVPEEIRGRVGPDEFAIWVPKGMVKPGEGSGG